jgi:hypothetical protein
MRTISRTPPSFLTDISTSGDRYFDLASTNDPFL